MRRRALLLLAGLLLASCGPPDVQAPGALAGRWEGHVAWRDATTPLVLVVREQGDSLAARLCAPALASDTLEIGRLSFDSPRVHFGVSGDSGAVAFDGWLRRDLIVGTLSSPLLRGERNRARLPQLALKRWVPPAHRAPWPESLSVTPPVAHEPQRSLAAWLAALAAR